jgi:hypothetical protein
MIEAASIIFGVEDVVGRYKLQRNFLGFALD